MLLDMLNFTNKKIVKLVRSSKNWRDEGTDDIEVKLFGLIVITDKVYSEAETPAKD